MEKNLSKSFRTVADHECWVEVALGYVRANIMPPPGIILKHRQHLAEYPECEAYSIEQQRRILKYRRYLAQTARPGAVNIEQDS